MPTRFALTIAVTLLITVGATKPVVSGDRPNVMVFLVDDMGIMDTSLPFLTDADGNPKRYPLNDWYRTPNMERLARQGIRFNQFYAMSVCSPTRISILTGQNAARHHATNWINPRTNNGGDNGPKDWLWTGPAPDDVTLPRLMRSGGYKTIHVGKGHFGPEGHPAEDPKNLGFDVNVAGNSWGSPGSYYGEKSYRRSNKKDAVGVPDLEAYHGTETFLSEALTIEAKRHVTAAVDDEQPFFLYFAHYAVHGPFQSDPRFADHYAGSNKPKNAQAFATLIEGMDKSLGDMMDHFESLGIAEDTIVIFLGDNGSDAPLGHQHEVACAAPLRGKKGSHYEGGVRVPFIASWAKSNPTSDLQNRLPIPASVIQKQVASVCDLFPTILQLVDLPDPNGHHIDGKPLQTLLAGRADENRAEQFLMHYPHAVHRSNYFTTWRDGDWKVIFHALPEILSKDKRKQVEAGNFQLFNLAADPFESTNLATQQPQKLREMMEGLIAALDSHEAQHPIDSAGNPIRPWLP